MVFAHLRCKQCFLEVYKTWNCKMMIFLKFFQFTLEAMLSLYNFIARYNICNKTLFFVSNPVSCHENIKSRRENHDFTIQPPPPNCKIMISLSEFYTCVAKYRIYNKTFCFAANLACCSEGIESRKENHDFTIQRAGQCSFRAPPFQSPSIM